MKRTGLWTMIAVVLVSLMLVLAGCSGGGTGGSSGSGAGTTTVSGKVTLSASVVGLGKPSLLKALLAGIIASQDLAAGTTGIAADTSLLQKLNAPLFQSALANAEVDMYNADHPEWLFPVSSGTTDAEGNYTLSRMTNASKNSGATYADGDPIPAGSYTLVAYTGFGLGQKPIVAVQSIVNNFEGAMPNVDFEVLPSDVNPEVIYMFGTRKITDGTERWGFDDTGVTAALPANNAIQISFSLPMWRDSLATGITIESDNPSEPPLQGKWTLSADWLTATFYLKPGVQMVPGQDYTITINGEDSDPNLPRALNVYGNALKLTATGKFTATAADAIGPTVQWNSPTVIEMGGTVDVTQSFRIESNKPLDVNGIVLLGVPSIGVKPGVLFLGRTAAGLYVYEFLLGEPLKLDTHYKLNVSGGRDLAGHQINTLTGSITTKDAASTPGIDPAAAPEVQNLQAQVKSVFGKWVRAMNDRNIATWQSVMSGEFYMEYDVATKSIDSTWDVNRDGRYSLGEYSRQLVTNRFPLWEFCGANITGVVTPTAGQYINVNPLTQTADFDFKLSFTNETNLTTCVSSAPKETFYMTLKFKNGGWKIVRGSIGVDTRSKELNKPNFISGMELVEDVHPWKLPLLPIMPPDRVLADGGLLALVPDNTSTKIEYSWNAAQGVTVYLLIVADERTPSRGFALAFPSTVMDFSSDQDPIVDLKAIDLTQKLGFTSTQSYANFKYLVGGKYRWEVVGLGSASAVPDPTNPNDQNFVGNKTPKDIILDISAVSSIRRFGVAGIYGELTVEVRAGSSAAGMPVVYSPAIGGYDLGTAYQATITVYTPYVTTPTGSVTLSAGARKNYDLIFTDRKATVTVPLYYGRNSFSVRETNVPAGTTVLSKSFQVLTLGGKQSPLSFWEVSDDLGNILSGDEWFYYKAPGASKINVLGALADLAITTLDWSLSNSSGSINISSRGTVTTTGTGDNTFNTAAMNPPDIKIYQGNNFITFSKTLSSGGTVTSYRNTMVVYTDAGSVWVPPIVINSITAAGSSVITKTNDYGTSSDWNAMLDPAANYTVTINGKFKTPGTGPYYVSSDGGYADGNVVSDGSGNFSLDVLLWSGWSYVQIRDSLNNYYYMNINAENGKPFNKPAITRIDGNAYDPAASQNQYADTDCSSTIQGTADAGQMYAYWDGSISGMNYSEYQNINNTDGTFAFTVPLVGPGGTNNVNIYDFNNRRTSITITTTGACAYSPPTFTLTSVSTPTGIVLPPSGSSYYAGGANTVTLTGTASRPGSQIGVRNWSCGQEENYTAAVDAAGSWSISGVKVYGLGSSNWNSLYLTMSGTSQYADVLSENSAYPSLRMTVPVTGVTGNSGAVANTGMYCGYSYWDAGAANLTTTVTGTTTVQSGTLEFTDTLNRRGQVQIVNGTFTIPNIPLFNGSNNYISIYNYSDPQGYSSHSLYITSSNGVPKPRFVTITRPAADATGITGAAVPVSGTITDTLGTGYSGADASIYASVYTCGSSKSYSNDSYAQQNYGYLPASVAAASFSFTADFSTGCAGADPAQIYVDVYDRTTGVSHYHSISLNGWTGESWNKPGLKAPKKGAAKFEVMEMLRGLVKPRQH